MDKFTEHLIELSDSLDRSNKTKCANMVDDLIKSRSITKIAQYVGAIGYVLKQNRAMGNCIRKKRVANSGSMQDVVLDCLKEYQDGQKYDNNEWTNKYAQVIQQFPEHFESSYNDYIDIISSENDIPIHISNVKKTAEILKENGISDLLFDAVIKDIEVLIRKGSDVSQRPFKVAAPPSPRSRWSRMWPGNWGKRGQDKDTKFEMNKVLEGISDIARDGKQIKRHINSLKRISPNLSDNNLAQYINQLSNDNWQQISHINNFLTENLRNDNYNDQVLIEDFISGLNSSINHINQKVENVNEVMRNLRLRDAVQGVSKQYAQLEKTLSRFFKNPLNEQSLYYAQIMHGRLEDALNNINYDYDEYDEWDKSGFPEEDLSPLGSDYSNLDSDTSAELTGGDIQDTANKIKSLLGSDLALTLSNLLNDMVFNSDKGGLDPEKGQKLTQLSSALRQDSSSPALSETPINPEPIRLSPESFNKHDIVKISDIVDTVSTELADLLDEYLEKQLIESNIPDFPDSSPIIKEEFCIK